MRERECRKFEEGFNKLATYKTFRMSVEFKKYSHGGTRLLF